MEISNKALKYLTGLEGCILKVKPVSGKDHIGVGHLITPAEKLSGKIHGIAYKTGITQQECEEILKIDLTRFVKDVNNTIKVKLEQHQFDALVMFAFNIGDGAFNSEISAVKSIHMNRFDLVPRGMLKWCKETINGKLMRSKGIINRRNKEIKFWLGEI